MSYKYVQFIHHAISTVAGKNESEKEYYVGVQGDNSLEHDIKQRIDFVGKVLDQIREEKSLINTSSDVLKVFMLPEFFFRGPYGAYPMGGYFDLIRISLRRLVMKEEYWKNWVFVFGTTIVFWSSDETYFSSIVNSAVDHLKKNLGAELSETKQLNRLAKDFMKKTKEVPFYKKTKWKTAFQTDASARVFLKKELKKWSARMTNPSVEIANICLIQEGGFLNSSSATPSDRSVDQMGADKSHVILKKYFSGVDFIKSGDIYSPLTKNDILALLKEGEIEAKLDDNKKGQPGLSEEQVVFKLIPGEEGGIHYDETRSDFKEILNDYVPRIVRDSVRFFDGGSKILQSVKEKITKRIGEPVEEKKEEAKKQKQSYDEYPAFKMAGIDFGLDICLDFSYGVLKKFLAKNEDFEKPDVQLIVACGIDDVASNNKKNLVVKPGGCIAHCDGSKPKLSSVYVEEEANYLNLRTNFQSDGIKIYGEGVTYEDVQLNKFKGIQKIFPKGEGFIRVFRPNPLPDYVQKLKPLPFSKAKDLSQTKSYGLAQTPIVLNGMNVIFDKPVPTTSVQIKPKSVHR